MAAGTAGTTRGPAREPAREPPREPARITPLRNHFGFFPMRVRSIYGRILLVAAAISATAGFGILVRASARERLAFAPFFVAVTIVAWLGGFGAGLVTAIVGYILADLLFIPPLYTMRMDREHLIGAAVYSGVVVVILAFARAMHSAFDAAQQQGLEALYRRDQLEAEAAEREAVQRELRMSEHEFRATFMAAGSAKYQIDPESWRFIRVNPKFAEVSGYSDSELAGHAIFDLIAPEDREREEREMRRLLRGDIPEHRSDLRLLRKDGNEVWVQAAVTLMADEEGRPVRLLGVAQDLTERRHAEAALRASEERFRSMADSAPVLIWMSGPDKGVLWLNRPWLDFRGREMGQEVAEGWLEGIHPEDREAWLETYGRAFDGRRSLQMEVRLRRRDGEYRWMLASGVPMHGGDRAFSGFIGSCIDITDRKLSEQERDRLLESERVARSDAERANRMKDEFLATISHELRTPLQAVLGWSRLVQGERLQGADREQGIRAIERNAEALAKLIDDLLDASRIISGKIRLDVQTVALVPVIEAALDSARPAAEAKGIELISVLDPDAGPVRGDPHRLQQIVWNLLSNAVKFTPKGGRVEVRCERRDSQAGIGGIAAGIAGIAEIAEIIVSDTGRGIRPEFLPHMFERFRQADSSTTRRESGLGLGLAIVRHLVELHGGEVRAESAGEGKGSSFRIRLPIRAVGHDGQGSGRHQAGAGVTGAGPISEYFSLKGVRILIVDDEPDARDLVSRILSEQEAEVRAAASAAEAWSLLETFRPNVLVSDIGMPEEDGYSFIRRVRKREPGNGGRIPAVALTAFARSEDRTRALLAGYQAHLSKPVEPAELVATLGSLAASRFWGGRARAGRSPEAKPAEGGGRDAAA